MPSIRCVAFTWNTANQNVPKEAPIQMASYIKSKRPHLVIVNLQETVRTWGGEFVSERIAKRLDYNIYTEDKNGNRRKEKLSYLPLMQDQMGVITKCSKKNFVNDVSGYTHLAIYVRSDLCQIKGSIGARNGYKLDRVSKKHRINIIAKGVVRDGSLFKKRATRNKGGLYACLEVFGHPLVVVGAHLDSNHEDNRLREVNELCRAAENEASKYIQKHRTKFRSWDDNNQRIPSLIFMGDLNERLVPTPMSSLKNTLNNRNGLPDSFFINNYDPISRNEVPHFRDQGVTFESTEYMTYEERFDEKDEKKGKGRSGEVMFKPKRNGKPDAGALDNIGFRDDERRFNSLDIQVHELLTVKGDKISDHRGVTRDFEFSINH